MNLLSLLIFAAVVTSSFADEAHESGARRPRGVNAKQTDFKALGLTALHTSFVPDSGTAIVPDSLPAASAAPAALPTDALSTGAGPAAVPAGTAAITPMSSVFDAASGTMGSQADPAETLGVLVPGTSGAVPVPGAQETREKRDASSAPNVESDSGCGSQCDTKNDCKSKVSGCRLYGFKDATCADGHCQCGACDPCNCNTYCNNHILNALYFNNYVVGTCQCRLTQDGRSDCHEADTLCVCSTPQPQRCQSQQPCYGGTCSAK